MDKWCMIGLLFFIHDFMAKGNAGQRKEKKKAKKKPADKKK